MISIYVANLMKFMRLNFHVYVFLDMQDCKIVEAKLSELIRCIVKDKESYRRTLILKYIHALSHQNPTKKMPLAL